MTSHDFETQVALCGGVAKICPTLEGSAVEVKRLTVDNMARHEPVYVLARQWSVHLCSRGNHTRQ